MIRSFITSRLPLLVSTLAVAACGAAGTVKNPFAFHEDKNLVTQVVTESEQAPRAENKTEEKNIAAANTQAQATQATPITRALSATVTFRKDQLLYPHILPSRHRFKEVLRHF